ncbi:hypothetical protein D3C85_1355420 [compost metagenome]
MTLERATAVAVLLREAIGADTGTGAVEVELGGLVEQQGDRLQGFGLGALAQFDLVLGDLELRLVDHGAVHRDPAALDVQLGLPPGATDQFDKAFGKANGFRHDDSRRHRERCPL